MLKLTITKEALEVLNDIKEMDIDKLRAQAATINTVLVRSNLAKYDCLSITQVMFQRLTDQGAHITVEK